MLEDDERESTPPVATTLVVPGIVLGTHRRLRRAWIPATSAGMTAERGAGIEETCPPSPPPILPIEIFDAARRSWTPRLPHALMAAAFIPGIPSWRAIPPFRC